MKIAEFCEQMGVEVSDEVLLAACYLQARGLRFAVDFGIENAEAMAEEIYRVNVAASKGNAR